MSFFCVCTFEDFLWGRHVTFPLSVNLNYLGFFLLWRHSVFPSFRLFQLPPIVGFKTFTLLKCDSLIVFQVPSVVVWRLARGPSGWPAAYPRQQGGDPFSHCKQSHLNSSQNHPWQSSGVTNVNQTVIAVWHWVRNRKTRGVKIHYENYLWVRKKRFEERKNCQPGIRILTSWFRLEGHDTDDPRSGPSGIGFRGVPQV